MSIRNWINTLATFNAFGGGVQNYQNSVNAGMDKLTAGTQASFLTATNLLTNSVANDMAKHGNLLGWNIRGLGDYSSIADSQSVLTGLTLANMNPWYNCGMGNSLFGFGCCKPAPKMPMQMPTFQMPMGFGRGRGMSNVIINNYFA